MKELSSMPLHEGICLQLEVPWGGPYDFRWAPNSMRVLVFRLRDGVGHSFGPSKLRGSGVPRLGFKGFRVLGLWGFRVWGFWGFAIYFSLVETFPFAATGRARPRLTVWG